MSRTFHSLLRSSVSTSQCVEINIAMRWDMAAANYMYDIPSERYCKTFNPLPTILGDEEHQGQAQSSSPWRPGPVQASHRERHQQWSSGGHQGMYYIFIIHCLWEQASQWMCAWVVWDITLICIYARIIILYISLYFSSFSSSLSLSLYLSLSLQSSSPSLSFTH